MRPFPPSTRSPTHRGPVAHSHLRCLVCPAEYKNVCIFVGADGPGATGASAGGGSGLQVASGGGK